MGLYRPFCKQNVYFDKTMNDGIYQLPKLFPPGYDNLVICTSGISGKKQHTVLITKLLPDLHLNGDSQCFPLYWYEETSLEQKDLFYQEKDGYIRHDGITDFIFHRAQQKYGPSVTKDDIFYYVYGVLHSNSYIEKFSNDLKMQLPRLPLVSNSQMFWKFSQAGRDLAELHLNYEAVPPYEGVSIDDNHVNYEVSKMRFPKKGQIDTIIYNEYVTIKNIPARAYEYVINGKSAIEWIMERYQITTHKDSGIKNDPNDWGREHGNPRYILDLLLSIINVSMQTMDIIDGLPEVDWDNE